MRAMPAGRPLDQIDVKILATLQRQGRLSVERLAEAVGLSARPCLTRVRRLEAAGIIAGYQAVVDLDRIARPVTVFAAIELERLGNAGRLAFERHLATVPEAVEVWEVSGAFDYMVRFCCADLPAYETLTSALVEERGLGIARIQSTITLRAVRRFAGWPDDLLARGS